MAQPADQPPIAALDIGSSKVSAIIARPDDDGRLTVLGTGQRESAQRRIRNLYEQACGRLHGSDQRHSFPSFLPT